jgi:cysteinyl-tRNA synthetase, unknown class
MRKARWIELAPAAALLLCPFGVCGQTDPRAEMIAFVQAIASHARAADPGFGVFPQNAAELGAYPEYVAVVTGMGQEDTYYGYKKDGKATPADVTAQIESDLDRFVAAGKLVLTVDYTFKDEDVPTFNKKAVKRTNQTYARSSARGYVPYCTVRNLNFLTVNPGHAPAPNAPPVVEWSQVRDFLFQLQHAEDQNRQKFLSDVAESGFDLVVTDYSFDGSGDEEFTPQEIATLKSALGGKLLAYLSIGEAEDYRWYWQEAWDADHDGIPDPGAPPWLDRANPDWPGNYKVRFWDPGWQAIVMQYLDRILAQGFDGAYLDLVDAYQYYELMGCAGAPRGSKPPIY